MNQGAANTTHMSERACIKAWEGSGAWEHLDSLGRSIAPVHHGDGAENTRKGDGAPPRPFGETNGRVLCRGGH
jgi:hypothetical protein